MILAPVVQSPENVIQWISQYLPGSTSAKISVFANTWLKITIINIIEMVTFC